MSNQISSDAKHDDISAMLPWFVNHTLDSGDRKIVSNHLETCKACQVEMEFLISLNEAAQSDAEKNYGMHANVDKNLASVMSRIDAREQNIDAIRSMPSTLKNRLGQMLSSLIAPPVAQWGATAMAGILVAVLGFEIFSGQSDEEYTVLSSPEQNNTSIRLSVELAPDTDWREIQTTIRNAYDKAGLQIEFESTAKGEYNLVFDSSISAEELGKIVVNLQNMGDIDRVGLLP